MKTVEQKIEKFVKKLTEKEIVINQYFKNTEFGDIWCFRTNQARVPVICLNEDKFVKYKVKAIVDFVSKQYRLF